MKEYTGRVLWVVPVVPERVVVDVIVVEGVVVVVEVGEVEGVDVIVVCVEFRQKATVYLRNWI